MADSISAWLTLLSDEATAPEADISDLSFDRLKSTLVTLGYNFETDATLFQMLEGLHSNTQMLAKDNSRLQKLASSLEWEVGELQKSFDAVQDDLNKAQDGLHACQAELQKSREELLESQAEKSRLEGEATQSGTAGRLLDRCRHSKASTK